LRIQFLFHGVLIRLAGCETLSIECPANSTVEQALAQLATQLPAMATELQRTACAQGDSLLSRSRNLTGDAEIALIPPVSGG
jgi:molybdopterin synthase sulfur carrier subunit